jgi:hypothetical protein
VRPSGFNCALVATQWQPLFDYASVFYMMVVLQIMIEVLKIRRMKV